MHSDDHLPITYSDDLLFHLKQSGLSVSDASRLEKIGYKPLTVNEETQEKPENRQNKRFAVSHKHVSVDTNGFIVASIAKIDDIAQWHALALYYQINTVSDLVDQLNRNKIDVTRSHVLRRLRCENPFFWVYGDFLHLHDEKTAYKAIYKKLITDKTLVTFDNGTSKYRGELIADYEPLTSHRVILPLVASSKDRSALAMAVFMHNSKKTTVKRSQTYIRAVLGIASNSTIQTYKKIAIANNWLHVQSGGVSYDDNGKRRYVANEYTSKLQPHYVKIDHYRTIDQKRYYFESFNEFENCSNVTTFGYEIKTVSFNGWQYFERKNINCTEIKDTNRDIPVVTDLLLPELNFDALLLHLDKPTTRQFELPFAPTPNKESISAGILSNDRALSILQRSRNAEILQRTKPTTRQFELPFAPTPNKESISAGILSNDRALSILQRSRNAEILQRTKPTTRQFELPFALKTELAYLNDYIEKNEHLRVI